MIEAQSHQIQQLEQQMFILFKKLEHYEMRNNATVEQQPT